MALFCSIDMAGILPQLAAIRAGVVSGPSVDILEEGVARLRDLDLPDVHAAPTPRPGGLAPPGGDG
jgi:hypothetical protein